MTDDFKKQAAIAAVGEIRDGMVVGLGTGSTAAYFIQELGNQVRAGLNIVAIPTSEASGRLAETCGIPLTTFGVHPSIEVTVDGADEVSPQLDLIKGLGGALVREKIVALASRRVVIIVDEGKLVPRLGTRTAIPVEVVPFATEFVMHRLSEWGSPPSRRQKDGEPVISDNGNVILDWRYGEIENPGSLEKQIKAVTGVVDSGLFCQVAQLVIVGGAEGIRRLERITGSESCG